MLEGVALKQEVIAHGDVVHDDVGVSAFRVEHYVVSLDIAQSYVAGLGALLACLVLFVFMRSIRLPLLLIH